MNEIEPGNKVWDTWTAHKGHKKEYLELSEYASIKISEASSIKAISQGVVHDFNTELKRVTGNIDVERALEEYSNNSSSFEDLKEKLEDEDINVDFHHDIHGEINGMILMFKGQTFKFEELKTTFQYVEATINETSNRKALESTDYNS